MTIEERVDALEESEDHAALALVSIVARLDALEARNTTIADLCTEVGDSAKREPAAWAGLTLNGEIISVTADAATADSWRRSWGADCVVGLYR